MAIAFRAAATSLDFGSTRSNSTLTAPVARVSGDRLLAVVELINSTAPAALSTPSGWTLLGTRTWGPSQSAYGHLYAFTRIADGTSADNLVTSHATMYSQAEMVAYSGVHASSPFDIAIQFANGNTTTSGASVSATPATTLTANALVVTFRHGWDGTAITPTSGWTERVDHAAGHVQDRLYATTASTGAISIPSGNTAGTKPWVTATIVLRDAASVDPPPYEPSWMDAVADAAAGTAQARMMFIGDSFTEGEGPAARADRWIEKVVSGLRTSAGIAGTGLGHTPPRYNTYLADSVSWRSPATASPTIANKVFARSATGYFQWTITGTAYTVLYNGGAGFGSLSVSTDGGAAETIAAASSGRALRWDKTGLGSGSHTVRVTAGTGGGQVVGIIAYNGDSPTTGLTYLDWAWTGATSAQFAPGGTYDPTGIQFAPHLVIDGQNGANDHLTDIDTAGGTPAPTPATVASRFTARVAEYRSWASSPLVALFVLPTMPTGSAVNEAQTNSQGYTLNDYRNACVSAATALDVPVIDCRTLVTLTLGDLASDNLHIEAAGHQAVADGIIDAVLDFSLPPSGGSEITATATTSGGGRKTGRGSSAITATATTSGGGRKLARAGSAVTATATTAGAGRKSGRGGSSLTASATASGAGTKRATGGSTVTATATTEGGGHRVESGSGGSVALATATTTGGGRKVTRGGSTLSTTAAAVGLGRKWITGGSTVTATATTTGGGHRVEEAEPGRGGSEIVATAITTGGGYKRARGGSSITATATVVGGGRNPDAIDPGHDTTVVAVLERPTRTITALERPTRTIAIKEAE